MTNPENIGAKYVRHSRDDVIAAALDILDRYGLADLTMRRLASTLDVQPSALYWHFPNKQTLLASVADRIVGRARPVAPGSSATSMPALSGTTSTPAPSGSTLPPHPFGTTSTPAPSGSTLPPHPFGTTSTPTPSDPTSPPAFDGDWKRATRAEVAALRDALLAYRDGAEVVSSTLALGLGADDAARRLARAIGGGGFDERTSEIAAATLLHFILGHVSHEQQRMQADSLGVVADAAAADPADAAVSRPSAAGGAETFDFGIALLLSGLEQQASSVRR